jgi:hypothetical protein
MVLRAVAVSGKCTNLLYRQSTPQSQESGCRSGTAPTISPGFGLLVSLSTFVPSDFIT